MDAAVISNRVDKGATHIFAYNGLVVIFPKDNLHTIENMIGIV
jgi:hypothetical protein